MRDVALSTCNIAHMGVLARLLGRRFSRDRGMLAEDRDEDSEQQRIPRPPPTRTMQRPAMPPATPTTRPLDAMPPTAGTRTYRQPGGTPSTRRIHNSPGHGGRQT